MSAGSGLEGQAIRQVINRLTADFAATYGSGTVAEVVHRIEHGFADSTVRDFVPVLVERLARAELRTQEPSTEAPPGPGLTTVRESARS